MTKIIWEMSVLEMSVDMGCIIRSIYKNMVSLPLDLQGQRINLRVEVADCFTERR